MCLHGSRLKKQIIFHILYTIVAPLCPAFLKRTDFYKAHRSEKWGVRWLASYPVCCDWPNASSEWLKCYAPSVLPDRVDDFQPKSSPKPAHFNKNQPKILTAKIMWYDFITMSIKINKDHFYLLKIK